MKSESRHKGKNRRNSMTPQSDDPDYEFYIEADLSSYEGEWVAIHNKEIVSHGENIGDVIKRLKQKYPKITTPFVAKVHTGQAMLL
jgi:hypothetical protein